MTVPAPAVTFYTITDARFAPATMAMINSLRLVGHNEPVVILDVGLRADQRSLLEGAASLIPFDRELATNPQLFKPFARLTDLRGVVVIIDSDQIVTRPLLDVIERAAAGAICAFPDPEADRWFVEWSTVFGLTAPLRRDTYVNSGFLAFSVEHWPSLLDRWWELCASIWQVPTIYEREDNAPVAQTDQDALNALLMSEVASGSVLFMDPDLAPAVWAFIDHESARARVRPLARPLGVRVVDLAGLHCRFRGKDTLMLHSSGKKKPWVASDWLYVRRTAYVRLLRRLLTAEDVPLRPARKDVPMWLRPGLAGAAAMLALNAALSAAWRVADLPMVRPLARRVQEVLR